MVIQEQKETLQDESQELHILRKKAMQELREKDKTSVICPRCGTSPKVLFGSWDSRIMIGCECGYVKDMEIYF